VVTAAAVTAPHTSARNGASPPLLPAKAGAAGGSGRGGASGGGSAQTSRGNDDLDGMLSLRWWKDGFILLPYLPSLSKPNSPYPMPCCRNDQWLLCLPRVVVYRPHTLYLPPRVEELQKTLVRIQPYFFHNLASPRQPSAGCGNYAPTIIHMVCLTRTCFLVFHSLLLRLSSNISARREPACYRPTFLMPPILQNFYQASKSPAWRIPWVDVFFQAYIRERKGLNLLPGATSVGFDWGFVVCLQETLICLRARGAVVCVCVIFSPLVPRWWFCQNDEHIPALGTSSTTTPGFLSFAKVCFVILGSRKRILWAFVLSLQPCP